MHPENRSITAVKVPFDRSSSTVFEYAVVLSLDDDGP